jgi:ABC-type nitrate/sulfonate/bicarbonate transport system permease component
VSAPTITARRVTNIGLEIGVTALIIACVWIYAAENTSAYLPSVPNVLSQFRDTWLFSQFSTDFLPSIRRLVIGYVIAVVVGVAIGIAIGQSRILRMMTDPTFTFLRSTPPPALLPFFFIALGLSDTMRISLIAFVSVWPVLLNTTDGVRSLDETMLATGQVFGIRGIERLSAIILPAIAPRVFAGARTALSIGLTIMIVSEMFASSNGIGYVLLQAQATFKIAQMWACILLLGILGYTLNSFFSYVERRVLKWYYATP